MHVGLHCPCSQAPNREDTPTPQPSDKASSINQTPVEANEFPQLPEGLEKKPIVLKFSAVMDGITIGAALLPSLKAEYKMGRMKSHGMTGESGRRLLPPDWSSAASWGRLQQNGPRSCQRN